MRYNQPITAVLSKQLAMIGCVTSARVLNSLRILSLWLVIVFSLNACSGLANHPPRNPHNLCDIFIHQKGWLGAAEESEIRWGVSKPIMMAIIYHESSFIADARPPYKKSWLPIFRERISSAYGYAQALDGTWSDYLASAGRFGAKRDNFADAIDFVGWYNHLSYKRSRISKYDPYRLYLAYHEGHTGYNRGSYRKKPWLLKVAARVQQRSRRYAAQLNACHLG